VQWLVASLVLSVVLTILLNVAVRVFPSASERATKGLADLAGSNVDDEANNSRTVRVFVPWKAMILASVILTVAINVLLWLT
jgi:hypothetical protein